MYDSLLGFTSNDNIYPLTCIEITNEIIVI
jgi:hypothetical protein